MLGIKMEVEDFWDAQNKRLRVEIMGCVMAVGEAHPFSEAAVS